MRNGALWALPLVLAAIIPAVGQPPPDPIAAYFDLMDFVRTQAWGRPVVTPTEERQRAATLLEQGWGQLDGATQAQLVALPQTWAQLQANWAKASDAEKQRQQTQWADALLVPGTLYPPPANLQRFTAEGNVVSFEYPADWTGGLEEIEGTPFLFLGPGGGQASWQQVFDAPNSPPGALFALADVPAEMQNATYVDGARYLAQMLIPNGVANLREIQALPVGAIGAIIALVGKFPGQSDERFFWIGVTQFGTGRILAGRLGGKVAEAEKLLPVFSHLLATLQASPPAAAGGGGGGEVQGAWDAAWARVGAGVVKNIWAPSGN